MFFAKTCIFMVLVEKYVLWVWLENTFLRFGRKKCVLKFFFFLGGGGGGGVVKIKKNVILGNFFILNNI